jgi:hypothetical protein
MATDAAGPHAFTDGSLVGTAQARYRVTANPARSSPNFHDDPDNLGTTAVSVNHALQRARARVNDVEVCQERFSEPSAVDQRAWVDRYMQAFERADVERLKRLPTEDPEVFACFGLAAELDAQGRSAR